MGAHLENRKIIDRLRKLLTAVNDEHFRERIRQLIKESEEAERCAERERMSVRERLGDPAKDY
jgi:hypothetical protein